VLKNLNIEFLKAKRVASGPGYRINRVKCLKAKRVATAIVANSFIRAIRCTRLKAKHLASGPGYRINRAKCLKAKRVATGPGYRINSIANFC